MSERKLKKIKKKFYIDVYKVLVYVIVTDDIIKEIKLKHDIFGEPYGYENDCVAICRCVVGKNEFGLFFNSNKIIDVSTIIHESFHLTHRILEGIHANFDEDHHEQGAYLIEYITEQVFDIMKITLHCKPEA